MLHHAPSTSLQSLCKVWSTSPIQVQMPGLQCSIMLTHLCQTTQVNNGTTYRLTLYQLLIQSTNQPTVSTTNTSNQIIQSYRIAPVFETELPQFVNQNMTKMPSSVISPYYKTLPKTFARPLAPGIIPRTSEISFAHQKLPQIP